MKNIAIQLGRFVYRATPFRFLRKLYYQLFLALVNGKKVTKQIDGSIYQLDLGEKIDVALFLGEFEKDLVGAIKQHCKPGMTVFDIGANIGAHALLFSKLVGERGHVYGFEPTEYAFKKLLANIQLNSRENISIYNLACSDRLAQENGVDFTSSWCTDGTRKDYPCTVFFEPLDHWIQDKEIESIDVLKLDVDGNEFSVLMGSKDTLKKYKPVIFLEVWGPNFKNDERNPFHFLEKEGYRFYSLDQATQYESARSLASLVSSSDGKLLDFSVNIIAMKS